MELTSASLISQAATTSAEAPTAAQTLVLRKALQLQREAAQALLQTLPPALPATEPQPLATEGPLGRQVNVWV
ncbi:hypothetical protein Talka_00659 [Tepidimonas alkaliphilus]|uniref:Motility protein n=1 Tax=Tepidimonas alkaliphilus TaxID=2588942 RepID=A0A554WBQ8_9BURK|nr:putative motility protein [Tepidimonas alkaliphilus]TSE20996.1 hypothetical protein Talka_00659 [Tepidimonas alkaliphilus]